MLQAQNVIPTSIYAINFEDNKVLLVHKNEKSAYYLALPKGSSDGASGKAGKVDGSQTETNFSAAEEQEQMQESVESLDSEDSLNSLDLDSEYVVHNNYYAPRLCEWYLQYVQSTWWHSWYNYFLSNLLTFFDSIHNKYVEF